MDLEILKAELARHGYRAVKERKAKAKAPSLTIWEKRRIARAYKGPSYADCIAGHARPEYIAQQVKDWIRVACFGPASAASHDHFGPRRLLLTSQYMHLDRRAEPKARPADPVYLPDAAEIEAWGAAEIDTWAAGIRAEIDSWAIEAEAD